MNNAMAIKTEVFSLVPKTFEEALKFSQIMAKSALVPKNYFGKPDDIFVAVQMGAEIGLKPMQSLQNIAVINGKPCIYGDACLALVKAHAAFEDIKEYYDEKIGTAYCEIKRKGQSWHKTSFSTEDAKKANLLGKPGPWTQYEKRMKQMRARGFNVRDTFPDALHGLITAEEAQDYSIINVTPHDDRSQSQSINEKVLHIKPRAVEEPTEVKIETFKEPEPTMQEQLSLLIAEKDIDESIYGKWLSKEGVTTLAELNDDQALKYINAIHKKYGYIAEKENG